MLQKILYNNRTNQFRCNDRFDFCTLLITMVDYNVFSFTRAYLDHFHWINWFYCASSQTFWHTPHFWKIIISWGKVGVIHVKTFETKLVTLSLTLKLQINIFQGFPKRYCKSKLVKAFQSYIFKVGNKKIRRIFFTNSMILQNEILQ